MEVDSRPRKGMASRCSGRSCSWSRYDEPWISFQSRRDACCRSPRIGLTTWCRNPWTGPVARQSCLRPPLRLPPVTARQLQRLPSRSGCLADACPSRYRRGSFCVKRKGHRGGMHKAGWYREVYPEETRRCRYELVNQAAGPRSERRPPGAPDGDAGAGPGDPLRSPATATSLREVIGWDGFAARTTAGWARGAS